MIEVYYFDKKLKQGTLDDLPKLKNKTVWVDCTDLTDHEAESLLKHFKLHPVTIEDFQPSQTRIKVEEFPSYLSCIFYGVEKNAKLELLELNFVLGKNFLITNHHKNVASFAEVKSMQDRMGVLLSRGPDYLFYKLLDMEVDNYFPALDVIDDEIEEIEEHVTRGPNPAILQRILHVKRMIVTLKKSAIPQREKISFLAKNEYPLISKELAPYFRDIYDHSIKVADTIDNHRETIGNTFDVYMSAVSNNLNEVMKFLSIIATIALPLTVISSIYGTNFVNLPGSDTHYGFWVMIGIMILLSITMIIYFKTRKWY